MTYNTLKNLKNSAFRRLTGIKRPTFKKAVAILKNAEIKKKAKGGKPNKLSIEDRLLMSLEYMREYRTLFHIAASYGVSESTCCRNTKWVEDTLVKHPDFALPGRKALLKCDKEGKKYEVVLIDATESPIERPKKNRKSTIQGRKKGIP